MWKVHGQCMCTCTYCWLLYTKWKECLSNTPLYRLTICKISTCQYSTLQSHFIPLLIHLCIEVLHFRARVYIIHTYIQYTICAYNSSVINLNPLTSAIKIQHIFHYYHDKWIELLYSRWALLVLSQKIPMFRQIFIFRSIYVIQEDYTL